MKKISIFLILMVSFFVNQAQTTVGTPAQIEQFLKTTTYVVLENNPMLEYNIFIKETVEKHWDLTKFEFVTFSSDEFEEARMDPNKSFLIVNKVFFEKDDTKAKYNYLCVILGGDYQFVNQMPDIAQVPIAYDGIEEDYYAYKLGMLVRFLQNHIKLTQAHPELNSKNILKYYYKNATADIHDQTLYVTESDLAKGFGMNEIKAVYPYNVKLVTKDEIEAAIDNHEPNIVFVHKVGPEGAKRKARCYKTIVGASDAKLYYFGWHMISDKAPEGLTKKDWQKLAKAKKAK
jgi:hypothetical protein